MKCMNYEIRADGIGVLRINVPGAAQNTLKEEFKADFEAVEKEIEASGAKAVVIISAKESSFIAGADIEMIQRLKTREDAEAGSRSVQAWMDRFANAKIPYVAAIHGPCLGGGLELALACHGRVATDARHTKLGLPEVQLGLLPGAGGTQRLPRLVGVEAALDLMLSGKQLNAKRARKIGLVDEVVSQPVLLRAAVQLAKDLAEHHPHRDRGLGERLSDLADINKLTDDLKEFALGGNPAGRSIVFRQAAKSVRKKAGEHYPAPFRILECVRVGLEKGLAAGLRKEAQLFGELAMSDVSKRLIEIFFATTELKKDSGVSQPDVKARPVEKVGILGAGIMGHGIAAVTVGQAKTAARIKDRNDEAVAHGLKSVYDLIDKRARSGRMDRREAQRQLSRLTGTTDYSGFKNCDVVIEAVFEDLAVKHQVLKEVEAVTGPETIFASNTSSIPITQIAEGASRPEMVVGMHYFSPVPKMPLLEVIRTAQTREDVVATVVALGKKQGKTVIVVNDGVGFYTSRILGPYMNEAAWMLTEGIPIETIDQAARLYGFPVGPITLLDEVGIDTAAKVAKIAEDAFGARMRSPGSLDRLIADGRTGRKGQKGFYLYGGKKKGVDTSVYDVIGVAPDTSRSYDLQALGERLCFQFQLEALRCFEEGILRSARDGDIGAIFGLGFPPFRGGPFRYTDELGAGELLRRVRTYEESLGERWQPPEILVERSRSGARFYGPREA